MPENNARSHLKLLGSSIALVLVIAALWVWLGRTKPVKIIVKTVDRGQVQDTATNTRAGTLKACNRAGLSPSTGGQIAQLSVEVGDTVKQGQLLLELWNDDLRAQVDLASSEAKSAEALSRQACVLSEVAARDAQRQRVLRQQGLTTEEAADKANGDARAQQASCDAARANAAVSRSRVAVARATLDRTRLTAPFAGVVAEINGEIGEFVTPSPVGIPTPPAIDLVDIQCLYVLAPIDEVDAPAIRVGMPVKISLDAFPKQQFNGKVRRIAPYVLAVEKQARTVDVEVSFIDPTATRDLLPGYSADIEVILKEETNAVRVPTEAILEGNKVLVFGTDQQLRQRSIATGLSNWEFTQVTSGLDAGERVAVSVDREGVKAGAYAEIEETGNGNQ